MTILPLIALADTVEQQLPKNQLAEIEYLIAYIRDTDCVLERNDERYSGEQAIEHILRKYDYYREKIHSAEDFIAFSASQSVISGQPYVAYCEGEPPVHGHEWLMRVLQQYRSTRSK